MVINPLTPPLDSVITCLLSGREYELALLRKQYECVKNAQSSGTRWYAARPNYIQINSNSVVFDVPDMHYRVGEYRRFVIDDVIAFMEPRGVSYWKAVINNGFLSKIVCYGRGETLAAPVKPVNQRLQNMRVKTVRFVSRDAGEDIESFERRQLTYNRIVRGQKPFRTNSAIQDLIKRIYKKARTVEVSLREKTDDEIGKFAISLSHPAEEKHIENFEDECGVVLSDELRELWRFSDGLALYENRIRGIGEIDERRIDDIDGFSDLIEWGERLWIRLSDEWQGGLAASVYAEASRGGEPALDCSKILLYAHESFEVVENWDSLERFVRDISAGREIYE